LKDMAKENRKRAREREKRTYHYIKTKNSPIQKIKLKF